MVSRGIEVVFMLFALGLWLAACGSVERRDPLSSAALERALAEPDWLARSRQLSAHLLAVDADTWPETLPVLERHLDWLETQEVRLFMLAWSRFDPEGALKWGLGRPMRQRRTTAGAAMYAWAFRDPEGAVAALHEQEGADLYGLLEERLVAGWAHRRDRDGIVDFLTSAVPGPRRVRHIETLAWELAKEGPDEVKRWAEGAPAAFPRFKAAVFLEASKALAASDPAAAAEWLAGFLDRPYADGVLRVVARSWALSDPEAALRWMMALESDRKRQGTVANAFKVWVNHDASAAERWLRHELPNAALDPAVRVMVALTREPEPDRAVEWALLAHDETARRRLVAGAARSWLRRDEAAARAWLAEAVLPPETRTAIETETQEGDDSTRSSNRHRPSSAAPLS